LRTPFVSHPKLDRARFPKVHHGSVSVEFLDGPFGWHVACIVIESSLILLTKRE